MSLDIGKLVGYLLMDTSQYDNPLDESSRKTHAFATSAPGWMGAAAIAIVAAAGTAGVALFALGGTFDDVSDTIRIQTGASGDELDDLADSADEVANRIPASFDLIGPALSTLNTRLGLSGDTLETVTSQFLEAGRILGEDINIDAATGALNLFKISGDETVGAMDTLFQISQATGVGINDLITSVQAAGPITQQLGFSFEETAAMIGVMDKAGLESQTMIAAMQKGLVSLTQPGESAEDAFKRVTGQIQGFVDTGDRAAAMDLAAQVFGTRGAAQFLGALDTGVLKMDDLIGSAGLSSDTILGVAESTQDFGEKWQLFVNDAMLAAKPYAEELFGFLSEVMGTIAAEAPAAFAWIADNMALFETFAVILGSFAAAWGIVTAAVAVYNAIIAIQAAVTTAGSVAQWLLNVAMTANPVGIIIVAVAALIAIIVLLVMNWDTVMKFLGEAWQNFATGFTMIMDGFLAWWGTVWDGFITFLTEAGVNIINTITGMLAWIVDIFLNWTLLGLVIQYWDEIVAATTAVWEGIVSFFTDTWNNIYDFFFNMGFQIALFLINTWNSISATISSVWGGIISFVSGVVTGIWNFFFNMGMGIAQFLFNTWNEVSANVSSVWGGIVGFFSAIPGNIIGFFVNAGTMLTNIGKDIIDGLLKGLKDAIGAVWNWITDTAEAIADTFADVLGIASPSKVFRAFGVNIGEGLLLGMGDLKPEITAEAAGLVGAGEIDAPDLELRARDRMAPVETTRTEKHVHVHMEANRSTLDEEAIYEALSGSRGWDE